MAFIDNELARISSAVYGEDMRRAIRDMARKLSDQMDNQVMPAFAETKQACVDLENENLDYYI